jgi:DNA ligase D-like protein (predicted ligase)
MDHRLSDPSASKLADAPHLPAFIEPMLARPGDAFDSDEHLFEIKWDGTRALAFIEGGGWRLLNRRRVEMAGRYPELSCLGKLPPGTVLDGEIVVLRDGKPDFPSLLVREQCRSELKLKQLLRTHPATYVVFDLLYDGYQSMMTRSLAERRERLRAIIGACGDRHLVVSEGIVGSGKAYFEEACRHELEGVVAKRLSSRYQPGQRTGAWTKIKRLKTLCCLVVGFVPEGKDGFGALICAAADEHGELSCVGKVGTGFDMATRVTINNYLWEHLRDEPVVPCDVKGLWVEPGLYCTVRCMYRTRDGHLREPVFEGLYDQ